MDSLTELYCLIDDFCRVFEPVWERHLLAMGARRRQRPSMFAEPIRTHDAHDPAPSIMLPPVQELLPRRAASLAALFDQVKAERDGTAIADATSLNGLR